MKKFFIFFIACVVLAVAANYHRARTEELGIQLVADSYYGNLPEVKEDLEQGAPMSTSTEVIDEDRQYNGVIFNALHAAASSGNEDLIVYLIGQGIDINSPTPDGWTPLFIAARDGQTQAAKLLVYLGADINAQTNLGATALHMVVTQPYPNEEERLSFITYLLEHDAQADLKDIYGHTPLYYAEKTQNTPAIDLLQPVEPARN